MEETGYYYVKNWWKHQGYRSKRPSWIRLWTSLPDGDPEFLSLSEIDQYRLIKLWLYASEFEGRLPGDNRHISRRLGIYHLEMGRRFVSILLDKGFISNKDIRGVRHAQSAPDTDTDTDTEKEKNKKKKIPVAKTATFVLPDWVPEENWKQYLEMRRRIKKPMTDYAMKLAVEKLEKLKRDGQNIRAVINESVMNSWQGLFAIGGKSNGRLQGQDRSDANRRAFEEALRRGEERDRQEALRAKRSDG